MRRIQPFILPALRFRGFEEYGIFYFLPRVRIQRENGVGMLTRCVFTSEIKSPPRRWMERSMRVCNLCMHDSHYQALKCSGTQAAETRARSVPCKELDRLVSLNEDDIEKIVVQRSSSREEERFSSQPALSCFLLVSFCFARSRQEFRNGDDNDRFGRRVETPGSSTSR